MTAVIDHLCAEYDPVGVYCKGHFSDEEFVEAVRAFDKYQDEENADLIQSGMIKRIVVRCVPYAGSDKDLIGTTFMTLSEPGRGAFPITYVDFENMIEFDASKRINWGDK